MKVDLPCLKKNICYFLIVAMFSQSTSIVVLPFQKKSKRAFTLIKVGLPFYGSVILPCPVRPLTNFELKDILKYFKLFQVCLRRGNKFLFYCGAGLLLDVWRGRIACSCVGLIVSSAGFFSGRG